MFHIVWHNAYVDPRTDREGEERTTLPGQLTSNTVLEFSDTTKRHWQTLNFDLPIYEQHALPPPPFVSRESSREPIDRKPTTHSRRELAYADESMQSIRNPFLDAAPSGDTPRKPMDRNPFEDIARPIIGSVVAHKPRITSHVAANIRLPLQAQVINCSSEPGVTPARDRRVRRVASGNGQGRQIDVEEGGLFFASRVHKFGQVSNVCLYQPREPDISIPYKAARSEATESCAFR